MLHSVVTMEACCSDRAARVQGESHLWGAVCANSGGRWGPHFLWVQLWAWLHLFLLYSLRAVCGVFLQLVTVNNASGLSVFPKGSHQHKETNASGGSCVAWQAS